MKTSGLSIDGCRAAESSSPSISLESSAGDEGYHFPARAEGRVWVAARSALQANAAHKKRTTQIRGTNRFAFIDQSYNYYGASHIKSSPMGNQQQRSFNFKFFIRQSMK